MRFDDLIAARKHAEDPVRLVAVNFQRQERRRNLIGLLCLAGITAVLAVLLWQVLGSSTQIGQPATESEALVRANERLLEMVKWTISTLLIVGGALIGLNWYIGEARFNYDRSLAEQERINYRLELEAQLSITLGLLEERIEDLVEELEWKLAEFDDDDDDDDDDEDTWHLVEYGGDDSPEFDKD